MKLLWEKDTLESVMSFIPILCSVCDNQKKSRFHVSDGEMQKDKRKTYYSIECLLC